MRRWLRKDPPQCGHAATRPRPAPFAGTFIMLFLAATATIMAPRTTRATPAVPDGPGRTFRTKDGVTIWYAVRGVDRGTPLVVVNGGPGFDHNYVLCSNVWDSIARTRPVVFYDQRGNGRSGALKPNQTCTLSDQIDDLDALRATLKQDRVDLLGHSWGGYLVMAYAAKHPDRVTHLIICDSAAPKWADTEFIFKYVYPEVIERQARLDAYDTLGDSTAARASLQEYMGMLFASPEKRNEFLSHTAEYHYTRAVNEALNADLAKYDLWPVLETFRMPTIVLTGRFDMNVAPSTAFKIHRSIPNSRFVVFEKSGHLPYFEEPDAFQQTVESFLGTP